MHCGVGKSSDLGWKIPVIILLFLLAFVLAFVIHSQ